MCWKEIINVLLNLVMLKYYFINMYYIIYKKDEFMYKD